MKKTQKKPFISVNIPTFNSASTLELTLRSLQEQTYKNFEVIIIDHYSADGTLEIAKKHKIKTLLDKGKLFNSRKMGVENSKGDFVVFLDSDQVLSKEALEKTVKKILEGNDMIVFEERSYRPKSIVERITDLDRKMVQERYELDPTKGVILPRVFKRSILLKVFNKLDPKVYKLITVEDHAIVYYEAHKISKKIGLVKRAVRHKEPETIGEIYKHYRAWGSRSKGYSADLDPEYRRMFKSKMRYRLRNLNLFDPRTYLILPLIILKGFAYHIGQK